MSSAGGSGNAPTGNVPMNKAPAFHPHGTPAVVDPIPQYPVETAYTGAMSPEEHVLGEYFSYFHLRTQAFQTKWENAVDKSTLDRMTNDYQKQLSEIFGPSSQNYRNRLKLLKTELGLPMDVPPGIPQSTYSASSQIPSVSGPPAPQQQVPQQNVLPPHATSVPAPAMATPMAPAPQRWADMTPEAGPWDNLRTIDDWQQHDARMEEELRRKGKGMEPKGKGMEPKGKGKAQEPKGKDKGYGKVPPGKGKYHEEGDRVVFGIHAKRPAPTFDEEPKGQGKRPKGTFVISQSMKDALDRDTQFKDKVLREITRLGIANNIEEFVSTHVDVQRKFDEYNSTLAYGLDKDSVNRIIDEWSLCILRQMLALRLAFFRDSVVGI